VANEKAAGDCRSPRRFATSKACERALLRRAVAALLLLALVSLTACKKEREAAVSETLAPAPVRVVTVESRRRVATEEVVGSVRAKLQAGIEAKISGRIERMLVVPGQTVKAGDLLVAAGVAIFLVIRPDKR